MASETYDLRFSFTFKFVRKLGYRFDLVGVDLVNNWLKFNLIGFGKHNESERCACWVLLEESLIVFYDCLYKFFLVSQACQRLVTLILFIQRQLVEESHKCKLSVFIVFVIGLGSRWIRSEWPYNRLWSRRNDYWSRRNDYWIGHIDWNVRHWDKQICRWSIRRIVSLACH